MDYDKRSVCSQEYITMPGVRKLDWPVTKVYSMPLKVAGQGHLLEKMWEEKRANHAQHTKKKEKIENLGILESKAACVNATTLKSQMARLNRHVELGLKKAEADLEVKRNKLREVILQEDTSLTHEYVEKAQKLADELYEEKKKIADEIVERHRKQQEEEAKEKLEQLKRDNSEELRERISIVKRLEAAEIQKQQICERKIQLQREAEFDNFWLELQKKRDQERLKYEEEEEQIRISRIKEQREVLNKQILGKLMMKDEMKNVVKKEAAFIDKLREQMKEEDEKVKNFKAEQKLEQMKIQTKQLEECRLLKAEREREAKEFDDYYVSMLNEAIKKENSLKMDTRAEVKKEAEFFIKQLAEIKEAQADEEKQIEELRAMEVKKKEAVIRSHQLALKEARDKLQRETLETWKQQIIQKQKELESEKKTEQLRDDWSKKMLDKNKSLDELLLKNSRVENIQCASSLEQQNIYNDILKERYLEDEKHLKAKWEEEQKIEHELIKSFGTCFGPPHPFTKAILDKQ